jgi:MarR family transcriptional regulator for hemolysin
MFRLAILTRKWRQVIDHEFHIVGLTEATWRPLLHLHLLGDRVRQKELAASVGIEDPTLVRVLDTLVDKGLIRRVEDSSDRRAKLISLTPEGLSTVDRIQQIMIPLEQKLLNDFSDQDIESIGKFILTLESNAQNLRWDTRK